jgi:putative flippase GtrA
VKLLLSLYYQLDHLIRELMKFGVVGACAYVIDVGLFNLLMYGGEQGLLHDKPLTAKTISVVLAVTFAYFGNRHWTFRHRDRSGLGREYSLFFLLNAVGLLIALSCLWFSHYVLGLTGPVADNISANVVGLALGTTFRFWSYRKWVFPAIADDELEAELAAGEGSVESAPATR